MNSQDAQRLRERFREELERAAARSDIPASDDATIEDAELLRFAAGGARAMREHERREFFARLDGDHAAIETIGALQRDGVISTTGGGGSGDVATRFWLAERSSPSPWTRFAAWSSRTLPLAAAAMIGLLVWRWVDPRELTFQRNVQPSQPRVLQPFRVGTQPSTTPAAPVQEVPTEPQNSTRHDLRDGAIVVASIATVAAAVPVVISATRRRRRD